MLEIIWGQLQGAVGRRLRTSTAMAGVYDANPHFRHVVKQSGGVRGLLRHCASITLSTPTAGGDNYLEVVTGETSLRCYDSVLGEQLRRRHRQDAPRHHRLAAQRTCLRRERRAPPDQQHPHQNMNHWPSMSF